MEIRKQLLPAAYILVVLLFSLTEGQHTVENVTLKEVLFSSPGYIDCLNYGVNMTRDYRFHTNYPGHTLVLKVEEFVLEPADKNGDCLYDRLLIYNGYNESAPILKELCGTISPGTIYTTSGDTVYVVFTSDRSHNYKGFLFSIVSDGPVISTTTVKTSSIVQTSTTTLPTTTTSTSITTRTSTVNAPTTDSSESTMPSHTSTVQPTSTSSVTYTTAITRTTHRTSTTETVSPTTFTKTLAPSTPSSSSTLTSTTPVSIPTTATERSSAPTTESTGKSKLTTQTSSRPPAITVTSSTRITPLSSRSASTRSTTHGGQTNATTTLPDFNSTTQQNDDFRDDTTGNDFMVWVIVGCCIITAILIIIIAYCCLKKDHKAKQEKVYPFPDILHHDNVGKTSFINRTKELAAWRHGTTDSGDIKRDIFHMDLPSPKQKANCLPPMSIGSDIELV